MTADLPQPRRPLAATPRPGAPRRPSAPHARAALSAFQPDAVELEERTPPRLAHLTLYALLALIAAGVAWASLSSVDEIVTAPGHLVTMRPSIVVQPLETAIIRSLDANVGDIVRKGQTLATLDSTIAGADVEQLQLKIDALASRAARLEAELAGAAGFAVAADARPDEKLQARLFAQRAAHMAARLHDFDVQIARAEAAEAAGRDETEVQRRRLETSRAVEDMRTLLFDQKNGSRLTLLQSQDARMQVEAALAQLAAARTDSRQAAEKAKAERASAIAEFRRAAVEQLAEVRDQRGAALEELKKAWLRQRMVRLTVPEDGIVQEVAQRSIGSVAREAETLFTLVPLDVPVEAQVMIDVKDIGRVQAGQEVRVKFDALPFQRHGTARGVIRMVSEDAFAPESATGPAQARQGAQAETRPGAFYRARVTLTDTSLRMTPSTFRLLPGLTVSAEIRSGRRTVMSYLLYPVLRGLDESFHEP